MSRPLDCRRPISWRPPCGWEAEYRGLRDRTLSGVLLERERERRVLARKRLGRWEEEVVERRERTPTKKRVGGWGEVAGNESSPPLPSLQPDQYSPEGWTLEAGLG